MWPLWNLPPTLCCPLRPPPLRPLSPYLFSNAKIRRLSEWHFQFRFCDGCICSHLGRLSSSCVNHFQQPQQQQHTAFGPTGYLPGPRTVYTLHCGAKIARNYNYVRRAKARLKSLLFSPVKHFPKINLCREAWAREPREVKENGWMVTM